MTYTHVSPKFQVVIPKEVRVRLDLRPKQRLIVLEKGGIIHLIPDVPIKKLKGIFKDPTVTTSDLRDKEDRV